MRPFVLAFCLLAGAAGAAQPVAPWRASTPEEQRLDASAFEGFDQGIGERLTDIQSVVVVLKGRTAYQYYRDGNPEALRDTQSVAKSALSALLGIALRQGHIGSLDRPVVELVPEWRPLNADPRAQTITLHHLLAMTAGFEVNDAAGTAAAQAPEQAWARPLRSQPGQSFAYDNSIVNLVTAVLEKVTARPLAQYAREQLVQPLGMIEPSYQRGLHLRTVDMAKLGHLFLQDGAWNGHALLAPGFAAQAVRAHSHGGPPVRLPYGQFWWVPSDSTYFASGYAGQFIWVHPPLGLVVAITSTVSAGSQQRGQAMELIRGRLFQAVQKRVVQVER
jgi:CubicO group peptidase (beta-lactamase class C family)